MRHDKDMPTRVALEYDRTARLRADGEKRYLAPAKLNQGDCRVHAAILSPATTCPRIPWVWSSPGGVPGALLSVQLIESRSLAAYALRWCNVNLPRRHHW